MLGASLPSVIFRGDACRVNPANPVKTSTGLQDLTKISSSGISLPDPVRA